MRSITSHGSPHTVFRRALARGDLIAVRAAAADLPAVPLDDALQILVLILEQEPQRFERAALRWLTRLLAERPIAELRQAELAVHHLAALPDRRRGRTALELLTALVSARPGGPPRR
ncbi:MAG TPA: hypothetical protein VGF21_02020 [Thermoleophilaceae bacterium]|jgi:hypothetical protein